MQYAIHSFIDATTKLFQKIFIMIFYILCTCAYDLYLYCIFRCPIFIVRTKKYSMATRNLNLCTLRDFYSLYHIFFRFVLWCCGYCGLCAYYNVVSFSKLQFINKVKNRSAVHVVKLTTLYAENVFFSFHTVDNIHVYQSIDCHFFFHQFNLSLIVIHIHVFN